MEETKIELQLILVGARDKELSEKEASGLILNVLMPQIGGKFNIVIDLVKNKIISPEEGAEELTLVGRLVK